MIRIDSLSPANLPEVLRIQAECYCTELLECAESFSNKLALYPDGCVGAWADGSLCGYLFAHPWRMGEIVHLDSNSYVIPSDANGMYVHDLAVAPAARGKQVARQLLGRLVAAADKRDLNRFALVAVQNSEPFWARWGFAVDRELIYAPGVRASYMMCEGSLGWR